jgi:hypothetical protein
MQVVSAPTNNNILAGYHRPESLQDLLILPAEKLKDILPYDSTYLSINRVGNCAEAREGARLLAQASGKMQIDLVALSVEELISKLTDHFINSFVLSPGEWLKAFEFADRIQSMALLAQRLSPKKYISIRVLFNDSHETLHLDGPSEDDGFAVLWGAVGNTVRYPHENNVKFSHYDRATSEAEILVENQNLLAALENEEFSIHRLGPKGTPHSGGEYESSRELRASVAISSIDKPSKAEYKLLISTAEGGLQSLEIPPAFL